MSGRLKQRSYQTREGEKRTVVELEVDEVGPSLKYATAKVSRVTRANTNGNNANANATNPGNHPWDTGQSAEYGLATAGFAGASTPGL